MNVRVVRAGHAPMYGVFDGEVATSGGVDYLFTHVDRCSIGTPAVSSATYPPLSIAVLLTLVAGALAMRGATARSHGRLGQQHVERGVIRFGFQAMFMLVLGHVLPSHLPCGAAWTKPSFCFKPAMGHCQNRPACHGPWLAELGSWIGRRGNSGAWCYGHDAQTGTPRRGELRHHWRRWLPPPCSSGMAGLAVLHHSK